RLTRRPFRFFGRCTEGVRKVVEGCGRLWKVVEGEQQYLLLDAEEAIRGGQREAPGGLVGRSGDGWGDDGPVSIEEVGFTLNVIGVAGEGGPREAEAIGDDLRAGYPRRRERIFEHEIQFPTDELRGGAG